MKFQQIAVIPAKHRVDEISYHHRLYALTEDGDIIFNDVAFKNNKNSDLEVPLDTWYRVPSPTEFMNEEQDEVVIEVKDINKED